MEEIHYKDNDALQSLVDEDFGDWSAPLKITQEMINEFAELSGDDMWLHVDEERCAKESPFGSTIAHGFLTLSLLPKLKHSGNKLGAVSGFSHMMNYGSDKLRFLGAVPVNSEIHSKTKLASVEVSDSKTKVTMVHQVHVVGQDTPALIYEMVFVYL